MLNIVDSKLPVRSKIRSVPTAILKIIRYDIAIITFILFVQIRVQFFQQLNSNIKNRIVRFIDKDFYPKKIWHQRNDIMFLFRLQPDKVTLKREITFTPTSLVERAVIKRVYKSCSLNKVVKTIRTTYYRLSH